MFDPENVERFNCVTGGCGDPECCGSYGEMELESAGDYVRASNYDALLALYHKACDIADSHTGGDAAEHLKNGGSTC